MCSAPKIPDPKPIPERQALKLPDNGATLNKTDDDARKRRAMMATAFTGSLGLGAPSTTSVLGG